MYGNNLQEYWKRKSENGNRAHTRYEHFLRGKKARRAAHLILSFAPANRITRSRTLAKKGRDKTKKKKELYNGLYERYFIRSKFLFVRRDAPARTKHRCTRVYLRR